MVFKIGIKKLCKRQFEGIDDSDGKREGYCKVVELVDGNIPLDADYDDDKAQRHLLFVQFRIGIEIAVHQNINRLGPAAK